MLDGVLRGLWIFKYRYLSILIDTEPTHNNMLLCEIGPHDNMCKLILFLFIREDRVQQGIN